MSNESDGSFIKHSIEGAKLQVQQSDKVSYPSCVDTNQWIPFASTQFASTQFCCAMVIRPVAAAAA
jgi:hypothetical protein